MHYGSSISRIWLKISLFDSFLFVLFCYWTYQELHTNVCHQINSINRSNHQRCSIEIGVLENFAKFTGKHLWQNLFFNKVAGLQLIKKETVAQMFSCEFSEIFRNTFFTEHLWWLLLY